MNTLNLIVTYTHFENDFQIRTEGNGSVSEDMQDMFNCLQDDMSMANLDNWIENFEPGGCLSARMIVSQHEGLNLVRVEEGD